MKRLKTRNEPALLAISMMIFLLLPSLSEASDRTVDCATGETITSVLRRLNPGDVVKVTGTCHENVVLNETRHNITLDGQASAIINAPDATNPAIQIRGTRITIKGFSNITGGSMGIQVVRGGTALIDNNAIQNTGGDGIQVTQGSDADITNNLIQLNANGNGIQVAENSTARIGFQKGTDLSASPNTIANNGTTSGDNGILVQRDSSARIVGNTISDNGVGGLSPSGRGVAVTRTSHADISSNIINNNAQDGIIVSRNSAVQLGSDTGTGLFDNSNTGGGNGGNGIRCAIDSSADGRIGALTGNGGAEDFTDTSCVNSLI